MTIGPWGPERANDLAALCEAALAGEELSADELLAICWDGGAAHEVVLGTDDGSGAVAACAVDHGGRLFGYLQLLVVHPDARRRGTGRALLAAAERWLLGELGAVQVQVGGAAPHYLWPGVDVAHTEALCLFEAAGYDVAGSEVNMSCPTSFRAAPPPGVEVRRAIDDEVVEQLLAFLHERWPWWQAEAARAVEHGCCHVALDDEGVVGFACHSVNRAGWIGPMGTDPDRQHGGVGAALLGQLCRDLQIAEYDRAEIAWVGPVGFYAKAAGATVSRSFRSLTKRA